MRLFGTDGVRGIANTQLTPELAMALGRAVVSTLGSEGSKPLVYIGRDSRISGDMLATALASGCMSAGADVVDLGILPTPGLAYLTKNGQATIGAMISASHNPAIDNGIKFFTHAGFKLPDALEDKIESMVRDESLALRMPGDSVGTYCVDNELKHQYLEYLVDLAHVSLADMRIVIDAANGAGFGLAPRLLERLGATVLPLHVDPNGVNINVKCGSTHPESMAQRVVETGADLGLALDGDADRLIVCDAAGNILDGDNVLYICGCYLREQSQLKGNLVVGTVMSNLGLDAALQREDITLLRAPVGDRYVLQEMLAHGAILGGEQSGHCIFFDHSTTGDGLLTAIMLLKAMRASGSSLAELGAKLQRFPQVLINVPVFDKRQAMESSKVREAVWKVEAILAGRGRILVRPSGTESIIRVMVEAESIDLAQSSAAIVVDVLKTVSA